MVESVFEAIPLGQSVELQRVRFEQKKQMLARAKIDVTTGQYGGAVISTDAIKGDVRFTSIGAALEEFEKLGGKKYKIT